MRRGGMAAAVLAMAAGFGLAGCGPARPLSEQGPRPHEITPPTREQIETSIARGVGYLLASQNADGSWGSARNTKELNIYAPVPGAHQAFRSGVTALAVMALCEAGGQTAAGRSALDRGAAWLMQNLPQVRRANVDALYNVWSHAYGIRALLRLEKRPEGEPVRQARIRRLIDQQVDLLARYECVGGGWGYYDFQHHTQQPGTMAMSFTSATVLIALHEARSAGVTVPQRLIDRGLAHLKRCQKPDLTYCYRDNDLYRPMRGINLPGSCLGRSQVCNLALRLWGEPSVTQAAVETWLDRLMAREGWLGRARKMPVPHESWFFVSGYFYYYGMFYAGGCIESLPPERRAHFQQHLAHILLGNQEKDGSWWDYPLYDYHKGWGTAMAVMALHRCRY